MLKSGELYDDSLDVSDTQKRKAEKLDSAHKIVAHQSLSTDTPKYAKNYRQSDDSRLNTDLSTHETGIHNSPKNRGRACKKPDIAKQAENNLI